GVVRRPAASERLALRSAAIGVDESAAIWPFLIPTSRLPRSRCDGSSTSALAITRSYFSAASAGSKPRGAGPAWASITGVADAGAPARVAPAAAVPVARKSRREGSMGVLLVSAEAEEHLRWGDEAK